ncbi:hypothetical protein [Alkalihalobacillus pseudalcaliphilus]|uniref:hypothetical protein n=1 Tax=Alkalihalobacillus pseudalcaliphilus TaxID=79884 RepID=UPI00064DFF81|nr:hypothetical protein [Alkalihalobacillus pseudalcaliphilus]KMK75470.1 hypothetical protein AB990_09185 [Alkalihalobacillus pseudalcaliphilus]
MLGIGKSRTKVGKLIDHYGYTQEEFKREINVNKDTASRLCNDKNYVPGSVIMRKVMRFIRQYDEGAKAEDYFDI